MNGYAASGLRCLRHYEDGSALSDRFSVAPGHAVPTEAVIDWKRT